MLRREYGKILSSCTSFKIGGPTFCWVEPQNIDDILEAVSEAERGKKLLTIIGKGSNVLVKDEGFDGIIINLGKEFDYIEREDNEIIRIGSGCLISRFVRQSVEWGLAGGEFLSGIPGSIGGAMFMNAGVRGIENPDAMDEIKDIIIDVDILDLKDKKRKILKGGDIGFSYRYSGLDGKCILGARVKLRKDMKESVLNRMCLFMERREWIKKTCFPSAGSVFKNPGRDNPAGRLIELCGLKGRRIGGAEISGAHANFIVNRGSAMSKDVMDLIDIARSSVREKFGIELELELRIL